MMLIIQYRGKPTGDDLPGCLRFFGRKAWTLASEVRPVQGVTPAGNRAHRKLRSDFRRLYESSLDCDELIARLLAL